jgi:hypothetical protein
MKWLRLYDEILDDPKVQMLPGELFKFWINLMALANRCAVRGRIEDTPEQIGWKFRLAPDLARTYMDELIQVGLVDEIDEGTVTPHNWNERQYKSDDATARSRDWRGRSNVASNNVDDNAILHATLQPDVSNVSLSVNSVNLESGKRESAERGKPQAPGQAEIPPQVQADIQLQNYLLEQAATLMARERLVVAQKRKLQEWFTQHKRALTREVIDQGIDAAATYTEGDSLNYLLAVMQRCIDDPMAGKPTRTNGKARDSGPDLKGKVPPNGYSWEHDAAGNWRAHEWSAETQSYPYGCETKQEALDITARKRQEYILERERGKGAAA